jgi:hypothetical protein
MITELIEEEARASGYDPPVESSVPGYAIVRQAGAFLFNDAALGSVAISTGCGGRGCSPARHPVTAPRPRAA